MPQADTRFPRSPLPKYPRRRKLFTPSKRPIRHKSRVRDLPHLAPHPCTHPRRRASLGQIRKTGAAMKLFVGLRSEEHTSELQSQSNLVRRLLFFKDTATTEIYTLSLHDALPISLAPIRAAVHHSARSERRGRQ